MDAHNSAFDDRDLGNVAQAWVDRMPPLDVSTGMGGGSMSTSTTSTPQRLNREGGAPAGGAAGGFPRGRRVAEDRGRYTGFDDGRFRPTGWGAGRRDKDWGRNAPRYGAGAERRDQGSKSSGGGSIGGGGYSRGGARGYHGRDGRGGGYSRGSGGEGEGNGEGVSHERGGGSPPPGGWADKYTR